MKLNDGQLKQLVRARAQLRLPLLDASGQHWKPDSEMPTAKRLTSRLSKLIRLLAQEEPYLSEPERTKWIKERSAIEAQLRFLREVKTWSRTQQAEHRAQFLCEAGLDLDTAMMLRGRTDADAVDAIREKAEKQIINLRLLAEHSSATNRVAVAALLKIAKVATEALNDLAVEKKLPFAVRAAKETDSWPVLMAEHNRSYINAKKLVSNLEVGSTHKNIRLQREARTNLTDPAGRVAITIRGHIANWRDQFLCYRSARWFRDRLPDWAAKIFDLKVYDKDTWSDWWEIADSMIKHSYKSVRYRQNYLGTLLKSPKTGKPLGDRLARQALCSRFKGQAPKSA